MAAPVFFGAGAQQNGIASVTVSWPANHAVDDVALLVIETDGAGTTLTPSGWTHVTGSPVTDVASAAGSKLHVLWRRATSTAEADVATGDSGDHQVARIFVFRGVKTTGDPWNAITTGTKTTASTTATLPSITTTVDESLIVGIASRPDDSTSTTAFGAPVNAGITWDSNADLEAGTNSGNGGGFVMVAGVEATAGATGTTTLTCPNVTNAYVTLGLTRTSAQSMTADVRSYAVTGQDAGTLAARTTTGDVSAFSLSGQNAGTLAGWKTAAEVGAFALTGVDVNFSRTTGYQIAADTGAFTAAGQDAAFSRIYSLTGATGAFIESGQDAALRRSIRLLGDAGSIAFTGQDAILDRGRRMAADGGSFTATGQDAEFFRSYYLAGELGAFDEQGQDAGLSYVRRMAVDALDLLVTGQDVTFRREQIVPPWTATASVAIGSVVRPTVATGTGLVFFAMTAGTTGATEPTWPRTFGGEVLDGTVTWRAVSMMAGNLQEVAPSAIIELFVLDLNALQHGVTETYRFHAGTNLNASGELVWNGQSYQRLPVEADGFEYNGNGQLPRPKIRVSNILSTITAILASLPNGLEGAKVTRIRTLARYIDAVNYPGNANPFGQPDPTAEFPREIYYIDRKTVENRDVVEFELAAAFDLSGVRAPKRQCIANICQWVYRSAECGYTGTNYFNENDQAVGSLALDVCGKRLNSCQVRFGTSAELPFGSFPGVGTYFS